MFRFLRNCSHDEDGQAMVELALTIPILLMVLCGIIDFGWFYTNQLSASFCSREGARYGVVNPSSAYNIQQRVIATAPTYMVGHMTVNVVFSNPSSPRSGDVSVEVIRPVEALTPIAGIFTSGQIINVTSKCVMKVE